MTALHVNDRIHFETATPMGLVSGDGMIANIFPVGCSAWIHVLQAGGAVRMLFEATSKIEILHGDPA